MTSPVRTNRLIHETSPYLLQHARNPVDWYPWGPEALERAKVEDKPILLSIGYSACHWCHVMEHESFENESIAALMNENYVCIKVDREERPDLDNIYMNAVQMMTGHGGWPMTVFLNPDGVPFYGGTYYPPEDRYNMPGFRRVLSGVAEAYRQQSSDVTQSAKSILEGLQTGNVSINNSLQQVNDGILDGAFKSIVRTYDPIYGGFGRAPKFPGPMTIEFLLRTFVRTGDRQALEMADYYRLREEQKVARSLGAVFIDTQPTRNGWFLTLKRCCMTMPNWPSLIFTCFRSPEMNSLQELSAKLSNTLNAK